MKFYIVLCTLLSIATYSAFKVTKQLFYGKWVKPGISI